MHQKKLPHDHGSQLQKLHTDMPSEESFASTAELMKLLSDGKRMEIFWLLCHGEECVVNLSALVDLSSPAVSHHLKLMKDASLIVSRRDGKEVYYTAAQTLRNGFLHEMIEQLLGMACPGERETESHVSYDTQMQTMEQVHALLTQDLRLRYTIEDLSRRFHMSPTTLKSAFKAFYGKPLAAYMKQYRIRRGAHCVYMPRFGQEKYLCPCGTINPLDKRCYVCGLEPEPLSREVMESLSRDAALRMEQEQLQRQQQEEKRLAREEALRQKRRAHRR